MNFHDKTITTGTKKVDDLLRNIFWASLEYIRDSNLVSRDYSGNPGDLTPLFLSDGATADGYELVPLQYSGGKVPIVGIDSSILLIGESSGGYLFSLKGSIISEFKDIYSVYRVGPFPLFYSLETFSLISELVGLSNAFVRWGYSQDPSVAKRVLIAFFEFILIRLANRLHRDSVIVLDGSLAFLRLLSGASIRSLYNDLSIYGNSLVGVSKRTRLVRKYPRLFSVVARSPYPCVVRIPKQGGFGFSPYRVYVGVFRVGGVPMRVDVGLTGMDSINILNYMHSASHTSSGYLEVLKEAHILSKTSRGEVICLKQYVESEFGVKFIDTFSLRDVLFGAFNSVLGGGNENL